MQWNVFCLREREEMSYLLPAVVVVVVGCFLLSSQFFDGNPISFVSLTMSKKQKKNCRD
jgi:hypothetical protein